MADALVTIVAAREIHRLPIAPHAGVRIGISNGGALREAAVSVIGRTVGADVSGRRLAHPVEHAGRGIGMVVAARSNDLPHLLAAGIVDLAITAHDYAADSAQPITEVADFGLVPGRIVALTTAEHARSWQERPRLCVCSQYPRIAAAWAAALQRPVDIIAVDGAAEVYPHIGVADLIVDNVSSGATATANDLQEVAFLMDTSLRLYVREDRQTDTSLQAAIGLLVAASWTRTVA